MTRIKLEEELKNAKGSLEKLFDACGWMQDQDEGLEETEYDQWGECDFWVTTPEAFFECCVNAAGTDICIKVSDGFHDNEHYIIGDSANDVVKFISTYKHEED